MSDLLVIVPTRGRPQNMQAFYDSWTATTHDADLLFVVDEDDPLLGTYKYRMRWMPRAKLLYAIPAGLRMVGALNKATQIMLSNPDHGFRYIGFMGDDHRCRTVGWDTAIRGAIGDRKVAVAYGNDLLQGEKMPTAVILTTNIVEHLGYMAPPAMQHLCVDLVWLEWAKALDCRVYLDHVVFEHMHPANGKAINDFGYQMANSVEQVKRDSDAYYAYMDGDFHTDVAKLKELL